jgi:hypothetical protein
MMDSLTLRRRSVAGRYTNRVALATALLIVLTLCSWSQSSWRALPFNRIGRVQMAYDQVTKRILLHREGTLIASTDMGMSWSYQPLPIFTTSVTTPYLYTKGTDSILITNYWGGIYVTTDGGKTLQLRITGIEQPWGLAWQFVTVNPQNKNEIWLYANDLYKSTNFGEHWNKVYVCKDPAGSSVVGMDPLNPMTMCFASIGHANNFYLSFDGGATWSLRHHVDKPPRYGFYGVLFTGTGSIYTSAEVTLDTGNTWYQTLQKDEYDVTSIDLAYNPKDGNIYSAQTIYGLKRIKDGMIKYENTSLGKMLDRREPDREANQIEIDTSSGDIIVPVNDTLYIGYEPTYRSVTNVIAQAALTVTSPTGSSDTLYAATPDSYERSTDGGNTWKRLGLEANPEESAYIATFPNNRRLMLFSSPSAHSFAPPAYSTNGGDSITYYASPVLDETNIGFLFDPFDPSYVYGAGNRLWRQKDSVLLRQTGKECEYLNQPNSDWCGGAFDPSRRGVFYCASSDDDNKPAVYRTTDYFKNWEPVAPGQFPGRLRAIHVHPQDPARLYVFGTNGLMRSTDTGRTWANSNTGFESDLIWSLAFDREHPNIHYSGCICRYDYDVFGTAEIRGGVYESSDYGETWHRLPDEGLYNWNIHSVELLYKPRRLLVGTGCGAYVYPLPAVSDAGLAKQSPCFTLGQNHPNPFSHSTVIPFSLLSGSNVTLTISNVLGCEVRRVPLGYLPSGFHSHMIDAGSLPAGLYFYRIGTSFGALTRPFVVAR